MEPREIIRYTPAEAVKQTECPACGMDMTWMKKPFGHIKKCFSIRRPGPVYRLIGYEECQCGMLIHVGSKAQKLHICVGKIPAYDPRVEKPTSPPAQESLPAPEPAPAPAPAPTKRLAVEIVDHKILQPKSKRWIRNFSCPIKQKFNDIQLVELPGVCKPKLKSVPRVRNFDMPSRAPTDEVSVYSIIRKDETISIAGGSVLKKNHMSKENNVLKKESLRLPVLRKSGIVFVKQKVKPN